MRDLIWKAMGVLADMDVGGNVRFRIQGTGNIGILSLERNYSVKDGVYLVTRAVPEGSNRAVNNYLYPSKDMNGMRVFLRDEKNVQTVLDSVLKLSKRADDFDD